MRYSNESLSREGSLSVFQDQADFAEIPTPSEGSVITPDASMMNFFQFDDTYTSDLDNRELIVRVDNPEKHSGALDSYVTFRITTNTTRSDFDAHEFVVRRRYKDFLWLKQQLERAHPGCILPALPEKSALQQRFSQEFLGGRVVGLHRFLNRLAEHPNLSTDPSLKLFLTAKPHVFAAQQGRRSIRGPWEALQGLLSGNILGRGPSPDGVGQYAHLLGEKLASTERIALRIASHQSEHAGEMAELHAALTLWAASEGSLGPGLTSLAGALERCITEQKQATTVLQTHCVPNLHEQTLLVESVKEALQRRDAAQAACRASKEQLDKCRQEQLEGGASPGFSIGNLFGQGAPIPADQQQQRLEELEKKLAASEECERELSKQLEEEISQWHTQRRTALRQVFLTLADQQLQYYHTCLSAWEGAMSSLKQLDLGPNTDSIS